MILPVGSSCNLRCSYCYHGTHCKNHCQDIKMSQDVFRRIVSESFKLFKRTDFLFHGGEPLLWGIHQFRQAIEFQNKVFVRGEIRNIVQTNATLVNAQWAQFFAKHKILVSTSLDGPRYLHNLNRYGPNKVGSFDLVIGGIKQVRATKRPMGVIALVTKTNVFYPIEVYQTIKSSGASSCSFHFCSETVLGISDLIPSIKAGINFFKAVFDLWFTEDDPGFMIRNFRNVLRVIYGGLPLDCASRYNQCRGFFAVMPNGDIYPCHRFISMDEFKLGNIMNKSLAAILQKGKAVYGKMAEIQEECFTCEWFKACGGGCAYERLVANGSFKSRHPECALRLELFPYIKDIVRSYNN